MRLDWLGGLFDPVAAAIRASGRSSSRTLGLFGAGGDWQAAYVSGKNARRTLLPLEDVVRLRRVRDLIDREYAEPLNVPRLAAQAHMSVGHFQRSFKQAFGETPYAWLMTRRVERAMALLRAGELSVTEVCMAVGCTSLGSFSARFTELVGETPSAYRARDFAALDQVPGCIVKQVTRPRRI